MNHKESFSERHKESFNDSLMQLVYLLTFNEEPKARTNHIKEFKKLSLNCFFHAAIGCIR